jgi:uncharacterized protein (DUF39 family)
MDRLKELFQQPPMTNPARATAGPVPLPSPISSSSQRLTDAEIHLMDGVHIPIPEEAMAHKISQAYTKIERPLYYYSTAGNKQVLEVRQVWEKRLDDGEWQVVRQKQSLVTKRVDAQRCDVLMVSDGEDNTTTRCLSFHWRLQSVFPTHRMVTMVPQSLPWLN